MIREYVNLIVSPTLSWLKRVTSGPAVNVSCSPFSFRNVSDRVALSIAVIVAVAVTVPAFVTVCACPTSTDATTPASTISSLFVLMSVHLSSIPCCGGRRKGTFTAYSYVQCTAES